MFDFRYHALSLTAVFIALAVGLLLGVAIGDSGLVSSAERNIRQSLKGDVADANRRVKQTRVEVARSARFEREVYPLLVNGQLANRNIGLVFLGGSRSDVKDDVSSALRDTGATLRSVAATADPPNFAEAASAAGVGSRYAALGQSATPDLDLVGDFGFRVGAQYVNPGGFLAREREVVFDKLNPSKGDPGALDAVVVVYNPGDLDKGPARDARDRFDEGLVKGMKESRIPVVGIERSGDGTSRIGWYKDRGISTVDDADETSGRAALVFALQGSEGNFGRKDGADQLLPDPGVAP